MTEPELEARQLELLGETREVYCLGTGPAVIVMHEVPGLHPGVVAFARRVAALGLRVYLPSLLGEPFEPVTTGYSLRSMARACVASEFTTWATRKTSPVVQWLRALAKLAHGECGGPGVGAIGMCLTGGFALAMMVDDIVIAPVLSQPSLPFGVMPWQKRDLGIDDDDLATIKQRCAALPAPALIGLRFTGDRLVPAERFQRLRDELGDRFLGVEIDSSRGNPHGIPRIAHSVLTHHFVDQPGHPTHAALEQVLGFFRSRLRA
ncbi:MAG: dienelactone hydrolase family protein [Deltaproteobacteria bacterium]|nr:dienelactone hydrolase family protein [Deltaproteobacteria bacterium]